MADQSQEFHLALDRFVKNRVNMVVIPATVSTVDFTAQTIDVVDVDDVTIHDVRLKAAVDSQERGVVVFPAEGSQVLIAAIGNDESEYTVIHFGQIHSVKVWINTLTVEANANGMKITRGDENFKTLLSDLLDGIIALTVTTPSGNSGPPINLSTFTAIKTRLNNLFFT